MNYNLLRGEDSHQDARNYLKNWFLMWDVGSLKLFQGIGGRPGGETIIIVEYYILLIKKTFYACQNLP